MGDGTSHYEFKDGRPFHDLVAAFLAATTGLGDVFDPNNPRKFSTRTSSRCIRARSRE
jgi:hypothetical protein